MYIYTIFVISLNFFCMPLPRLSFSCECFYVALVAGQEKGIGKTIHTFINLKHLKNACVDIEPHYIHIVVIVTLLIDFLELTQNFNFINAIIN